MWIDSYRMGWAEVSHEVGLRVVSFALESTNDGEDEMSDKYLFDTAVTLRADLKAARDENKKLRDYHDATHAAAGFGYPESRVDGIESDRDAVVEKISQLIHERDAYKSQAEALGRSVIKHAELKVEIAQLKKQLHQTETERNMASDCVRADGEEIARLREENGKLEEFGDEAHIDRLNLRIELARMQKALEELAKDGCVMKWGNGLTCVEQAPTSSEIFGVCTGCIAVRALNPQTAQSGAK